MLSVPCFPRPTSESPTHRAETAMSVFLSAAFPVSVRPEDVATPRIVRPLAAVTMTESPRDWKWTRGGFIAARLASPDVQVPSSCERAADCWAEDDVTNTTTAAPAASNERFIMISRRGCVRAWDSRGRSNRLPSTARFLAEWK